MVEGHKDAPVLVVMPYMPDEGMLHWFYERMREFGIKSTDIRTVFILEEAPENSGGRPSVAQIRAAQDRAAKEIEESNPRVVVPMGSVPLKLLTGLNEGAEDARGYLISPSLRGTFVRETWEEVAKYKTGNKSTGRKAGDPKYGWVKRPTKGLLPETFTGWVIPMYELYTVQVSGFSLQPAIKADMKRVMRALTNTLDIVDDGFTYYTDIADLHGQDYDVSRAIAVDIETTGVGNRVIERVSISNGLRTHTLPWTEETRVWLNRQIALPHEWIIFHNAPFDLPRLRESGIDITVEMEKHCIFDSMFGGVVALPDLPKGLGKMATIYLDLFPWKWPSLRDADPIYYSAKDAYVTALMFLRGIRPMIEKLGMWSLVTGRNFKYGPGVMATIPTLSDLTEGGIRKDREQARVWSEQLNAKLLPLLQRWTAMYPLVDPGSNKDLMNLFYRTWRLPVIRTKKQRITVNEYAVMKGMLYIQSLYAQQQDQGPWKSDPNCNPATFQLLLDIRETTKQLTTYCTPILDGPLDYVHPSYLPLSKDEEGQAKGATATGRLAAGDDDFHRGLNIQNQTKEARKLFVPDDAGMCFVEFDYSKAELWAMAAMAQDDVMLNDLRSGDPYQAIATSANVSRKTGKNVTLAGQYLAGPPKQSEMILKQEHIYIEPAECKRITDVITARWQKRTAYVRWLVEQCKVKGYLINPFGRLRVFHDRRAAAAVDFIPQSIVADMLWCVLRPVAEYVKSLGGRLTTTVHDSILVQVPEYRVEECAHGVKAIMERRFDCVAKDFYVPVEVKAGKAGASWHDLVELKVA